MNLIGLRVLVVEDEPIIAMMIECFLEGLHCKLVSIASRLDEALEQARTLDLDVGMLDVNLAGQLSYPVADVLRGRSVPFLFATGYGTPGAPPGLINTPVLSKPFGQEQLAQALLQASSNFPNQPTR